jgi:hypothetical protein
MVEQAREVARPLAFYRIGCIEGRGEDWVDIHGVRLESRGLRERTSHVNRVFFYVATCGLRLDEWSRTLVSNEEVSIAEVIKEMALEQAREEMFEHMAETWRIDVSSVEEYSPGVGQGWSITQMPLLFQLLGDTQARLGVSLTSSFEYLPKTSVAGMIIPDRCEVETCQYCPNEECEKRMAPCHEEEVQKQYSLVGV